ncbi:MAG: hypothetical protein HY719_06140 [Planctomycetes bacterium]|nr:hypothetical protein [Planctomycetota bacterium]
MPESPSLKFGEACIQAGFITPEQLEAVLLDLAASGDGENGGALTRKALGAALVERGLLTKAQVRVALALQRRQLYACASCGKRFVIKEHDERATYKCKACGDAPLVVVAPEAGVEFDAVAGRSAEVEAVTLERPTRDDDVRSAPVRASEKNRPTRDDDELDGPVTPRTFIRDGENESAVRRATFVRDDQETDSNDEGAGAARARDNNSSAQRRRNPSSPPALPPAVG